MQNFKPIFPGILQSFGPECHSQTSYTVAFFMFGLVFMKFRKLKDLHREKENLNLFKIRYFYLSYSLFYGTATIFEVLFQFLIDIMRLEFEKNVLGPGETRMALPENVTF